MARKKLRTSQKTVRKKIATRKKTSPKKSGKKVTLHRQTTGRKKKSTAGKASTRGPALTTKRTPAGAGNSVDPVADFNMENIDPAMIPAHVAIILDGNGRWAKKRGLSRSDGHRAGGENLDRLLDFFIQLKVPVVSLYAFSTENWKRPEAEVKAIWRLLNEFFKTRSKRAMEMGICIRASGNLERLPRRSRRLIEKVTRQTAGNRNLVANFCVNYGSRSEIVHAATQVVQERLELQKSGDAKAAAAPVEETELAEHLYTKGLPDVDLLVRPGGESRISNFLLWQCAYAEIYVTETLWPDFSRADMKQAIDWYQNRHRRFGGL